MEKGKNTTSQIAIENKKRFSWHAASLGQEKETLQTNFNDDGFEDRPAHMKYERRTTPVYYEERQLMRPTEAAVTQRQLDTQPSYQLFESSAI
ncbi:hypothetical protein OESDEN_01300 [Oesophagostomum dentatum]|uniref:Uncharacterized protein n=1 Tax=Oesophagostomum dentatum TaxID=61180 RepID=A0A0B1TRK2_OESDE|nr:hypothetical protein OESDEN_01300 [Oesophagostomum dentatum]